MDQKKIGAFLKELRGEKGMTQEQLAEQISVSGRTVSRWETGSNLPDLSILVELADFYGIDIRELINGERKSENMDKEAKDTLVQVARYAQEEKIVLNRRNALKISIAVCLIVVLLAHLGIGAINENHRLGYEIYRESNTLSAHCDDIVRYIDLLQREFAKDEIDTSAVHAAINAYHSAMMRARMDFGYEDVPVMQDVRAQYWSRIDRLLWKTAKNEKVEAAFRDADTAKEIALLKDQLTVMRDSMVGFHDLFNRKTEWERFFVDWSEEREKLTERVRIPD